MEQKHSLERPKGEADTTRRPLRRLAWSVHLCLLAFGAMLPFTPPHEGPILILPVLQSELPTAWAHANGARLLSAGPFPNSVVVYGRRADLIIPAALRGQLLASADFPGCRG